MTRTGTITTRTSLPPWQASKDRCAALADPVRRRGRHPGPERAGDRSDPAAGRHRLHQRSRRRRRHADLQPDHARPATSASRTATPRSCGATRAGSTASSTRARCSASNQGDTVTVILHNTLPRRRLRSSSRARRTCWPTGRRRSRSSTAAAALTSLTNVGRGGRRQRHLQLRGRPTRAPSSTSRGTEPREAGADGTLRRAARAARSTARRRRYAYNRADSQFTPGEEFMVLLSEIDPYQHQAVEQGKTFNMNNYHPRYWLINGRGFPDSIADNGASLAADASRTARWPQVHPYDRRPAPAARDWPATSTSGTEDYPFHPHGNNGLVIGRDGHPLGGAGGRGPLVREVRRSTSVPGRPGTCSSSGTTPRTTTRRPTRSR